MAITDADQEEIVYLLLHDLHATVGPGHDHLATDNAVRIREFADDIDDYVQRVVEHTQQDIHDSYIDTTWPKCPRHVHPLWFREGAWWCEHDNVRIAQLGDLPVVRAV